MIGLNILAIDPGGTCTGLAWTLEDGERIVRSARPKARNARDKAREIVKAIPDLCWHVLVIEIPQVYADEREKDPNDLIKLSVLAGNLEALIPAYNVLEVLPREWKGQVPKTKHHKQIRARADFWDRASKDAMDALGLLLYGQDVVAAQLAARKLRSER